MSHRLLLTVKEAENRTGRRVKFKDIDTHPLVGLRHALGYHEIDQANGLELIWLSPSLPRDVLEVVAAHELMHSLQTAEGFCLLQFPEGDDGNPVFPEMTSLAVAISSMINDPSADRWCADRGFSVKSVIRDYNLPLLVTETKRRVPLKTEHTDWDAFNGVVQKLAESYLSRSNGPFTLPPEIQTLRCAVDYAKIRIRFAELGLFDESLDRILGSYAPVARTIGLKLTEVVSETGVSSRDQCQASMIAVAKHLNLNPRIACILQPLSSNVVWPITDPK